MADSQTKTEAAADKALAEASQKAADSKADKGAGVDLKAVEKAVETDTPAPAKAVEASKATAANSKATTAKKKPVSKSVAGKKKVRAGKPATKRSAPAKKTARPRTTANTKRSVSRIKETIMATAKTTTTDFAATAEKAAAEMQTRAKAAFEKGTELTGEVTEFHKGNMEALVETGKLLASGMQDLGRTYMEDARTAADTVTEDVKKMAAIKSPTELFQLQGEIARRNFDAAVAQTSKNTEAMMKLVTEAFAPLSNRASVAAEKISKAA